MGGEDENLSSHAEMSGVIAHSDVAGGDLGPETRSRRACEPCRSRKVGCDRGQPCSTCVRSQVTCIYAAPQSKRPQRQRILISPQYERKIDRIEERLASLVDLLGNLKVEPPPQASDRQAKVLLPHNHEQTPSSSVPTPASIPASTSSYSCVRGPPTTHTDTSDPAFVGESSMAAQYDFANNFLEQALHAGPLQDFRLEMDETLGALRSLVHARKTHTDTREAVFPHARSPLPSQPFARSLPNATTAMASISVAKDNFRLNYLWLCNIMSIDSFTARAIKVLFSSEYSEAEYIIVSIGLYWLFNVLTIAVPDQKLGSHLRREDLVKEGLLCRENLETSLSTLPFNLPSDQDHIEALIMAAFYAVDNSKPSLAWSFCSASAQRCLSLGLHRDHVVNQNNDFRNRNQWLFWTTYVIDKALSLRLGRPSNLPDYDITVLPPNPSLNPGPEPWSFSDLTFVSWIHVARIQGRAYEELYSPAALRQSDQVRRARVKAMADEVKAVMQRSEQVNKQSKDHLEWATTIDIDTYQLMLMMDKVLNLSVLTLLYRAIPSPPGSASTFTPECVETARLALERHEECVQHLKPYDSQVQVLYLHWTIHYNPFNPFIVIFCHVIETSDMSDLNRLHDCLASFEPLSKTSEATARIHRLFNVLYNVALKYVEVKQNQEQASVSREFDAYLTALGFNPGGLMDVRQDGDGTEGSTLAGTGISVTMQDYSGLEGVQMSNQDVNAQGMLQQGMLLGGWFHSNQQMMGLLEEDTL
ncbi:hypothetical protein KVR01_012225 [Diaporthe batatas]|uniref:uncharacterized protein n=1 Tax=Diaporthe batatas TaxID=748121 RepID=UPI001D03E265|nr:uncharacterized protein KVR01_012225 [Diaporthe batatas]KAG8157953.1 hypothetical protein KVR01_012225 [Diaporthe batatas]